jgi:DNA invertase Pin-like site-specific DNA recombinase
MSIHSPARLRPEHLDPQAFIYVRQSTLAQVREHSASTARQYQLIERARGWPEQHISVIDADQGRSGASAAGRDGFARLIAEVGLGHAGAVLSLEASRLARSGADWHRLIEICALTDTLLIDEDGVHDPGQYHDRLLLGFRGTMSAAELHWLRSPLLGGKLEKARHGQLRQRLAVGLIYDPLARVVLDPDEEVQHAVRRLFDHFAQSGSALAVVSHFARHGLRFATRYWGGARDGALLCQPLRHSRVLAVLHNPAYAGAYVYGRTQTRTRVLAGEAPRLKGRTRQVKPLDWPIVLRGARYIDWPQFLASQQRLDDNRTVRAEDRRGAVRVLQGIVLCGRCGRRMSVRYLHDGRRPVYECHPLHSQLGAPTCQFMGGDSIDAAVAQALLEALTPAQITIALAAFEPLKTHAESVERH